MPPDRRSDPSDTAAHGGRRVGARALRLVFSAAEDLRPVVASSTEGTGDRALSALAWRLCEVQMQLCFALWALPPSAALRPSHAGASVLRRPSGPHLRRVK